MVTSLLGGWGADGVGVGWGLGRGWVGGGWWGFKQGVEPPYAVGICFSPVGKTCPSINAPYGYHAAM